LKKSTVLITFLALFFLTSTCCYAHKIRVFAYGEGDNIIGETSFNGGRTPKNVEIIVENASDGSSLLTTMTDDEGRFSFPVPEVARQQQLNLRIVVNVGEGHRNEWLLEAAEYLPEVTAGTVSAAIPPSTEAEEPAQQLIPGLTTPEFQAMNEVLLRQIVEESIEKQLGPVKRMLAENRERKVSLQDILGGIGYIFGLAGIAAYLKSKKGDSA
jgi:nickel transport protein